MKQPTAQRNEWEVVEGDNGNVIEITLTDDGSPVDLTSCKVLAVFGLPTGQTVEQDTDEGSVTIGGTDNNVITIALKTGSFSPGKAASGLMKCEIQVYSGDDLDTLVTSAQFTFRCRRAIINDETIAATDDYPILVELIEEVQHLIAGVQSDWDEADPTAPEYINNKPTSMTPTAHHATHEAGGSDEISLPTASTSAAGIVQLDDSYVSISQTQAATANAVRKAYLSAKIVQVDFASISSLPATANDDAVTNKMMVIGYEIGTPSVQTSDWTVDTSDGSVTVSGTMSSGTTTLTLFLADPIINR